MATCCLAHKHNHIGGRGGAYHVTYVLIPTRQGIYAARAIFPHLAGRQIKLDARKTFGIRRFSSDLPGDFGLRAVMGYLPESTAR